MFPPYGQAIGPNIKKTLHETGIKPGELIILVGLPGSGKSTYCESQLPIHYRINQDEMGSRELCLNSVRVHMHKRPGNEIVIDRCNHTAAQRKIWIDVALQNGYIPKAIYLSVDPEECMHRIHLRKDHPTIKEDLTFEKKRAIVAKFFNEFELPQLEEGFKSVLYLDNK